MSGQPVPFDFEGHQVRVVTDQPEALPFSRNGHSGYQILWNPAVAEQMKEVA